MPDYITDWFNPHLVRPSEYGTVYMRDWAELEIKRLSEGAKKVQYFIKIREKNGKTQWCICRDKKLS